MKVKTQEEAIKMANEMDEGRCYQIMVVYNHDKDVFSIRKWGHYSLHEYLVYLTDNYPLEER